MSRSQASGIWHGKCRIGAIVARRIASAVGCTLEELLIDKSGTKGGDQMAKATKKSAAKGKVTKKK